MGQRIIAQPPASAIVRRCAGARGEKVEAADIIRRFATRVRRL